MSKHTPGPWKIKGSNIMGGNLCADYVAEINTTETGSFLHPLDEESYKNAHLIAAAPEMLEALKHSIAIIKNYTPKEEQAIREIRYAIARAEGRE